LTEEAAFATERADAAFDRRFMLVRPRLLAICTGFVGRETAEDVVHDAYEKGRRTFGQLRDTDAFDAWITRIAINLCKDANRRHNLARARLPHLMRRERAPSRDVALAELVERLPARDRTILVLHYGHGYRLDEIASLLDMSHTNVRTVIHRTRHRLAAQWLEGHDR
jgi:RNA polymerase sigma factor (sigma-70 family)